jgi:hypothetical protein
VKCIKFSINPKRCRLEAMFRNLWAVLKFVIYIGGVSERSDCLYTAVEIRWHTRRNQISSFGETDESM